MNQLEDMARIFKALSDPNRLAILQLIRERCGPDCGVAKENIGNAVSDIASEFDLSISTVSHHIKELRRAGLIRCKKRGQWVYCEPNSDVLDRIEAFVKP